MIQIITLVLHTQTQTKNNQKFGKTSAQLLKEQLKMSKLSDREKSRQMDTHLNQYMEYVDQLVFALERANKVIQVADQITSVLNKQLSPSHRTNNRMERDNGR